MPDVNFVHESGDVAVRSIEVRIDGDSASITGLVSTDVWEHIEREDVFGAAHRRRAGELTGSGDVKIEITGAEASMTPGAGPFARDWQIESALRRVDDAPGEVWIGMSFTDPPQWAKAADALVELGFSVISTGDTSVDYADGSGTAVTVSANTDARLGSITCHRLVGSPDPAALSEVLVVVNHVNDTFPAGTLSFAGDTLTMKSGVPIPESNDVSDVLEALAYGLPGMLEMVAPAIQRVASGDITSTDAIHEIFG
jgi:hypothetical protein